MPPVYMRDTEGNWVTPRKSSRHHLKYSPAEDKKCWRRQRVGWIKGEEEGYGRSPGKHSKKGYDYYTD